MALAFGCDPNALIYAATLAATSASLLRAASGKRGKVAGTVRVTASEVIAVEVLPPILASLADAHPALCIELSASDAHYAPGARARARNF